MLAVLSRGSLGTFFISHLSKPIAFGYWKNPGPFAQLKDVQGPFGRFLGFWTVMIQASYSFFGAEVPGVAGSEVISASKVSLRLTRRYSIGFAPL